MTKLVNPTLRGPVAFLPRKQLPLLLRLLLTSFWAVSCPGISNSCLTSPICFPPSFPREWILRARPEANSGFDRCLTWRDLKHVTWALSMGPTACVVFKEGSFRMLPRTVELVLWPGMCHLSRSCRMPANLSPRKNKARPCVHRHSSGISVTRQQSDGEI